MRWIGLTGGIASGKSTVGQVIEKAGFSVVDADQLAREVLKTGPKAHNEIVAAFGQDVATVHGEIDRAKLGQIVFADKEKLRQLEGILHPRIRDLALQRKAELESKGVKTAFYMVPLLFEKNMQDQFDEIVVVSCPEEIQKERLIKRDGLSDIEAKQRLAAQLPLAEKIRQADHVIENSGTKEELEEKVRELVGRYRS